MKTTNADSLPISFNKQLTEQQFERIVKQYLSTSGELKNLVPLLQEQHPIYRGKSRDEVVRMRAFIFYTFYLANTPEQALMFIYEELESGRDPYLIATAAMALRKCEMKRTDMARLLLAALGNVRYFDSALSIGNYYPKWPAINETTAVLEILHSFSWLGAYARLYLEDLNKIWRNEHQSFNAVTFSLLRQVIDTIEADKTITEKCCEPVFFISSFQKNGGKAGDKSAYDSVGLEDQDGYRSTFNEFLGQKKIALIAFFYTRCDNPLKCSLTITNLAKIQELVLSHNWANEVELAAISYDSDFDGPSQLRRYGEARGISFNEQTHFFRILNNFDKLKNYFDLSVNYAGSTVNRHTIELYLLAPGGEIISTFSRGRINNDEIVTAIQTAIAGRKAGQINWRNRLKTAFSSITSLTGSFFIIILPKCPLCFAVYFSMLGIAGAPLLPYVRYIFPCLVLIIAINLFFIYRAAKKRNGYVPFFLAAFGAISVIVCYKMFNIKFSEATGFLLLFTASVLNAIPNCLFLKLRLRMHIWTHYIKQWVPIRVLPWVQNTVKKWVAANN